MTYTRTDIVLKPHPERGSKEIWVKGEYWLNAIIHHAGVHWASHFIQYPDRGEVIEPGGTRRGHNVRIRSLKMRRRDPRNAESIEDQPNAIISKVLELINSGYIESPATRQARRDAKAAAYKKAQELEEAERSIRLNSIRMIMARNLSGDEVDAMQWLYREAFAVPMPISLLVGLKENK